ncbi:MAG TPA: GNAT family N-acetyltransferase [Permianibacter sp.]|nr:GNAT family N-acetyltransferase [Permianibacter sp.]
MEPRFRILRCSWRDHGALLALVRQKVFAVEMRIAPEHDQDGRDPGSFHVLAVAEDGAPVGAGRLEPNGTIGRIAVLMPWRQHGVGSALLEELIAIALERGQQQVTLAAPITAQGFYETHQFQPAGCVYMEAGIPHRTMRLALGATRQARPQHLAS